MKDGNMNPKTMPSLLTIPLAVLLLLAAPAAVQAQDVYKRQLYYLALERIAKKWTMPIHNWPEALNRFALEFGDRMPPLN